MVVNKPAGLLTIPTPKNETRTLTSILNEDLEKRGLSYRLHPCHRLDRETSGLIIYAKGKSTQQDMMEVFHQRQVKKTYIAFVQGRVAKDEGQMQQSIEGQSAITKYRVIEKRKDFTVVEATPLTGRTNQIRIHFKQIGHPIVGETIYAFRRDFKLRFRRLCLHAKTLEFVHPATSKPVALSTELPEDLKGFLNSHD